MENEKKLIKLLEESLSILDRGSLYGIDWDNAGEFYTKAKKYLEKIKTSKNNK